MLDRRLREALCSARVRELDALVLAAAGTTDPLATQSINRLARLWGHRHKLPVMTAYASAARRPPARPSAPSAARAVATSPSARCSSPPASSTTGPPSSRSRPVRSRCPQPFGADPEVARTILARYLVGAVELVPV